MIYPTTDDVLAALIDTFDRYIVPEVHDEYAASLCLTVSQMLRSVRVRVAKEAGAIHEDNQDLRELLTRLRPSVSGSIGGLVDSAVAVPASPGCPALDDLQAEALVLREALSQCIEALPDRDGEQRRAVRGYLQRHLERQMPWTVTAFTGPRR